MNEHRRPDPKTGGMPAESADRCAAQARLQATEVPARG